MDPAFLSVRKITYSVVADRRNLVMNKRVRVLIVSLLTSTSCMFSLLCSAQIIAEARNGPCHLTAEGEGLIFTVHVDGLSPGESLSLKSVSNGESLTSSAKARPDGSYGVTLLPAIEGKSSGKVTISVKSSRCQLQITFPWHN